MDKKEINELTNLSELLFQEAERMSLVSKIQAATVNGDIASLFPEYQEQKKIRAAQTNFLWVLVYALAVIGVVTISLTTSDIFPTRSTSMWIGFLGCLLVLAGLGRRIFFMESKRQKNKKLSVVMYSLTAFVAIITVTYGIIGLVTTTLAGLNSAV